MLELHKFKAGAKTQSEEDVYQRQIRAVDESIDRLVYALYGLSEEEIGIVEGRPPPPLQAPPPKSDNWMLCKYTGRSLDPF